MIRFQLPTHLRLPTDKKGLGWPVYVGTFLEDGSVALVAGRAALWQRLAIFDRSLRLVREVEITSGASDASQPECVLVAGGALVVIRRWGPNIALDPTEMRIVPLAPIFDGAITGAELPDGRIVAATAARNRGEQTQLRAGRRGEAAFGPWGVALIDEVRRASSPLAAVECGKIVLAGEQLLVSTFQTMKRSTAAPMWTRVDWRRDTILAHAPDPDVVGRDGDVAWDPVAEHFVLVSPARNTLERRSTDLSLVSREPLSGHRLLALDSSGRALWLAGTSSLVLTHPGETPSAPTSKKGKAAPETSGFPALEILFANPTWSIQVGDRMVFPEGARSVTLGAAATSTLRITGDKKVAPTAARFDRTDDGWKLVAQGPFKPWVNGTEYDERLLAHGDLCHAGTTFRFLERPWIVARDPAMEAAIEAAPDVAARWIAYAEWLREHGDPLGDRMLEERPRPAHEDARWLGTLGDALVSRPAVVRVDWHFGLPRSATLSSEYDVHSLITTHEARFLRHLVLDFSIHPTPALAVDFALSVLAAAAEPKLLETLSVRLGTGRALQKKPWRDPEALYDDVRKRHPRLVTTWNRLFAAD
ncbi:MAG: hypothetical protein Q8N26_35015 [Myxococcales bacterium]|nr:hypothetical protein [Myxococcales bacterium]